MTGLEILMVLILTLSVSSLPLVGATRVDSTRKALVLSQSSPQLSASGSKRDDP